MISRRTFLRGAAAAAALSAIPRLPATPATAPAANPAPRPGSPLQLTWQPNELRLRHAFNVATYSRTSTPDILVRITCDGITGYGEASMPPYLGESMQSVDTYLRRVDLSQFNDPFRIADIHDYLDTLSPQADNAAKAAVDIALHDLCGKIMGRPWYAIWGLDPGKAPCTSFTIGIDTPDIVRQKTLEAAPYRILKVKMGVDGDRLTLDTIRSIAPDTPVCVDCNQGWHDKHQALDMCHWLAERGCLFVEQPFPKQMVDEQAWLCQHSPLPIIADEAVRRLTDIPAIQGLYHGINIKLMKSTGMHEAYQMACAARALGLKIMIGCMTETSCAVTAAAHLSPMAQWADLDGNLLIADDPFRGVTLTNGRLTLPSAPGLGISPA